MYSTVSASPLLRLINKNGGNKTMTCFSKSVIGRSNTGIGVDHGVLDNRSDRQVAKLSSALAIVEE